MSFQISIIEWSVFCFNVILLSYSLSGHPSRLENWPFSQCLHVCMQQCCTLKCSATHPVFNPVRNVFRLIFCCAQWAKICYSCSTADEKWRPLTVWTLGQWISWLIAGESDTCHVFWNISKVTCGRCAMTWKCNLPQNRPFTHQFQFANTINIKQGSTPKIFFLNFHFSFERLKIKQLKCISLFMGNASLGCQKVWKWPVHPSQFRRWISEVV